MHVFSPGGLPFERDHFLGVDPGAPAARGLSESKTSRAFGAWETYNAWLLPGANAGDYFSGDLRRPFTDAGMWGLLRIFDPACSAGCPERLG